jgi:LysR family glycine cleavage system transcriptional activator
MSQSSKHVSNPALLGALWFFEAAVRHRSFTEAALELGVTQAAVSHRIRELEATLSTRLFRRTTRRLEITDEGMILGDAVRNAFSTIDRAIETTKRGRASGEIVVSAPSTLLVKWLIPRLGLFAQEDPGVAVSVLAEDHLVDLSAGSADVAIRFGPGPYPGNHVTRLATDSLFPAVSPTLATKLAGKPSPRDLVELGLLADSAGEENGTGFSWDTWARGAGIDPALLKPRHYFNRSDLMIQAAIAGQGVALGRAFLTLGDIENKFLVVPTGPIVRMKSAYHFLTLPEKADAGKIKRFRNWMIKQAYQTDRLARQLFA